MVLKVDPGLAALFGSADRVRALAALANATAPLTAYRVAAMVGMEPPNVYRELKRLREFREGRRAATPEGRNGWAIADPDVRTLFRRRLRIVWSEDLLRGMRERERRAASNIRRSAKDPLDLSKFQRGRPPTEVQSRRRREKDRILAQAGMRVSVRSD